VPWIGKTLRQFRSEETPSLDIAGFMSTSTGSVQTLAALHVSHDRRNHGRRLRQIARCDAYQCGHPIFLLIFTQGQARYEKGAGMRRMDLTFLAITAIATVTVGTLLAVWLMI